MKNSGRTLKRRLYALSLIGNRLSRIKYFRGHGVHSPFVYSLVRNVFMNKGAILGELYNKLISLNFPLKRARELQRVANFCNYESWAVDDIACTAQFNILTTNIDNQAISQALSKAGQHGTTVVVMLPYFERERTEMCQNLIINHRSTSVDNRGYIIFFNNHLPKQHYRL